MNGKIIGGVIGLFVVLIVMIFAFTFIMPMLGEVLADPNIGEYTGLSAVLNVSLTIVALVGIGGSAWAIIEGIRGKRLD